jgi:hypothetical protein
LKESTEKQLAFIILDIVAIIAILGVVLLADLSDQQDKNALQKMILGDSILGDWISISPGSFSTMGAGKAMTIKRTGQIEMLDYIKEKLPADTSKTYTVKGKEYQVKVTFLAGQQAKFGINGEITEVMYPDTVMKLADGSIFIMTDVSIGAGGQPLAGFIIVR